MDSLICPRCKSSKYRNPSLVLMVNVCGHVLCESCVEQLFVRGSGACPQCQKPLKRNQFRAQFFEDAEMDKEVDIRRKVSKELFLREEDFLGLRDFNDYLEIMESIVFNMTNNLDLDGTRKQMDGLKEKYKKELQKAKNKKSKDQELLQQEVAKERTEGEDMGKRYVNEQMKAEQQRAKDKDKLLDELQDSEMSAAAVMAIRKRKMGDSLPAEPVIPHHRPVIEEAPPVLGASETEWFRNMDKDIRSVEEDLCGPEVPSFSAIEKSGYLGSIRTASATEIAMGFPSVLPARRALLAAYDGLFMFQIPPKI